MVIDATQVDVNPREILSSYIEDFQNIVISDTIDLGSFSPYKTASQDGISRVIRF